MVLDKDFKALLVLLLNNEITVLSWGITNIEISSNNMSFEARGLRYQGKVNIYLEDKRYKIVFNNKTIYSSLGDIVSTLDSNIEKTDNYMSDIVNVMTSSVL